MSESEMVPDDRSDDSPGEGDQIDESGRNRYCLVDDILSVVSKKYGIRIIGLLERQGPMRTTEIRDAAGIGSPSTLSNRLQELGEAQLLEREQYNEIPPRVEYSLTPKGEAFSNSLKPLVKWAHEG